VPRNRLWHSSAALSTILQIARFRDRSCFERENFAVHPANTRTDGSGAISLWILFPCEYTVAVSDANSWEASKGRSVLRHPRQFVHFELTLPTQNQTELYPPTPRKRRPVTPTNSSTACKISRKNPALARPTASEMITNYVPESYFTARSASRPRRTSGKWADLRRLDSQTPTAPGKPRPQTTKEIDYAGDAARTAYSARLWRSNTLQAHLNVSSRTGF